MQLAGSPLTAQGSRAARAIGISRGSAGWPALVAIVGLASALALAELATPRRALIAAIFTLPAIAALLGYAGSKRQVKMEHTALARLFSSLLVAVALYNVLFPVLPTGTRLAAAGALSLAAAGLSLVALGATPGGGRQIAPIAVVVGSACCAAMFNVGVTLDATEGLRFFAPLLVGAAVVVARNHMNVKILTWTCVALLAVAFVVAMTRSSVVIGNVQRFAPFTGGDDGAHSSAYVVLVATLGLDQARRRHVLSNRVGYALVGVGIFVLVGYRVATALLMLAVYSLLSIRFRSSVVGGLALALAAGLFVGSLLLGRLDNTATTSNPSSAADVVSSGRATTWQERIDLVADRPTSEIALGSGLGSDSFTSTTWWWAKKNSHNDFIETTVELGLVGLVGVAFTVAAIGRAAGRACVPLFAALAVGSMASNALVYRPMILLLFWIPVVIAGSDRARVEG